MCFFLIYFSEDNVRIVTEAQGVRQVICALKTHKYTPELVEAASSALVSLSMEGELIITSLYALKSNIMHVDVHYLVRWKIGYPCPPKVNENVRFYILFNSQDHIRTEAQHYHL